MSNSPDVRIASNSWDSQTQDHPFNEEVGAYVGSLFSRTTFDEDIQESRFQELSFEEQDANISMQPRCPVTEIKKFFISSCKTDFEIGLDEFSIQ